MIENLHQYFLPEQEYYLNEIAYEKIDNMCFSNSNTIMCEDNINVKIEPHDIVKVIVTRKIYFEPEDLFNIKVSFGSDLKFNTELKKKYNWQDIDLADEFRKNGDFVISHLVNRICLMIAQITSSYGNPPLILPPTILKNDD